VWITLQPVLLTQALVSVTPVSPHLHLLLISPCRLTSQVSLNSLSNRRDQTLQQASSFFAGIFRKPPVSKMGVFCCLQFL
jgi:hypothetical protein